MFNQFTHRSINTMNRHMGALEDSVDNINNMFTVGYKAKHASFHETVKGLKMTTQRDQESGVAKKTNRELDFAIDGVGFFEVQMPDGTLAYTRNGSFQIGPNGELLSAQGYQLTNQAALTNPDEINDTYDAIAEGNAENKFSFGLSGQSIQIPTGKSITMGENGDLTTTDGKEVGKLVIVTFPNIDGLRDIGDGLLLPTDKAGELEEVELGTEEGKTKVRQGHIEMSNIQIMDDTSKIVQLNTAIKAEMKVVKLLDQLQESLNSTITRNI